MEKPFSKLSTSLEKSGLILPRFEVMAGARGQNGCVLQPCRAKRQSSAGGGRRHERDTFFSTKNGESILEHEICGVCIEMGARGDFLALLFLFLGFIAFLCMYRGGMYT